MSCLTCWASICLSCCAFVNSSAALCESASAIGSCIMVPYELESVYGGHYSREVVKTIILPDRPDLPVAVKAEPRDVVPDLFLKGPDQIDLLTLPEYDFPPPHAFKVQYELRLLCPGLFQNPARYRLQTVPDQFFVAPNDPEVGAFPDIGLNRDRSRLIILPVHIPDNILVIELLQVFRCVEAETEVEGRLVPVLGPCLSRVFLQGFQGRGTVDLKNLVTAAPGYRAFRPYGNAAVIDAPGDGALSRHKDAGNAAGKNIVIVILVGFFGGPVVSGQSAENGEGMFALKYPLEGLQKRIEVQCQSVCEQKTRDTI